MSLWKVVVLIFFGLLFVCEAEAQEKKISFLNKGEHAKYAGYLLSPAAFAEQQIKLATQEALSEAKLESELAKQKAVHAFAMAQEKADNSFLRRENILIGEERDFWKKTSKNTLWERIDFATGLIIGTVGSYYITTLMIKSTGGLYEAK